MSRSSAYGGAPVNLYEIVYGENPENKFRFTNHHDPLSFEGHTWVPSPIKHGKIKQPGRPKNDELVITISRKSPLAEHVRGGPPRRVLRVRVLEADVSSGAAGEVIPIWHGRLSGIEPKGAEVVLKCAPAGSRMKMPALTRTYSRQCSVVLYGPDCKADKTAATESTTINTVPGVNVIELASGWEGSREQADFLGGTVEWTSDTGTEYRAIINIDNNILTLDGPAGELEFGDSVDVVLGCPRTLAACRDLHDNINNYGGCPYIPYKNIVQKSML